MNINIQGKISQKELKSPLRHFLSPLPALFHDKMCVEEVLELLKAHKPNKSYLYVTNQMNRLLGIVTMTRLIHSRASTLLKELVDEEIIVLHEDDSLEHALRTMTQHEILSIPVVNTNKELIGVIEVLRPNHASVHAKRRFQQDLFQMIGFSLEIEKLNSCWVSFRYRMPWLLCNVFGGLLCAMIGGIFQLTLVEFVMLALFIPLVLALNESVAIQAMTLSLRIIHFKRVLWSHMVSRLTMEWKTALLLGIGNALVIGVFYLLWSFEWLPMVAIGVSIILSMMFSGCFGSLFPILLHRMKLDPKIAAGPVVLMVADVLTVSIYLTLSTWILIGFD